MKNWVNPEFKVLNLAQTAFGPNNPDREDFIKHAVIDEITGEVLGWEAEFGQASGKPKDQLA